MSSELKILGGSGNEKVQLRILHYLKGGRVHPGIILSGSALETKSLVAQGMAKFLLCENKSTLFSESDSYCGTCSTCSRIDRGLHPDVITLNEEGEIKIGQIREICHQMEVSPIEAESKICIIENCHRLNKAAANAFLKTLEEPATNRFFILLTDKVGSLLPTILSRCLKFTFKPQTQSDLPELEKFATPLTESLSSHNLTDLLSLLKSRESCEDFIQYLQQELRNHVLDESGSTLDMDISHSEALQLFEETLQIEKHLSTNANCALLMEGFLRRHFFNDQERVVT